MSNRTRTYACITSDIGDAAFEFMLGGGFFPNAPQVRPDPHFHACAELHIVAEGEAVFRIDGKPYRLLSGDMCLIKPMTPHYLERQAGLVRSSMMIGVSRRNVRGELAVCEDYLNAVGCIPDAMVAKAPEDMLLFRRKIIEAFESGYGIASCETKALFTLLFAGMLKEFFPDIYKKEHRLNATSGFSVKNRLMEIDFFVGDNYNKPITLSELAEYMHLSRRQADRTVRQLTGQTFQRLLLRYRMLHARLFLEDGKTAYDTAELVGYASYHGFYNAYRNFYGCSPAQNTVRRVSAGDSGQAAESKEERD